MEEVVLSPLHEVLVDLLSSGDLKGELMMYSGRGMYGRYCVGYAPDREDESMVLLGAVIMDAARRKGENFADLVLADLDSGESMDSLGRGFVVYWPRVKWVGPEPRDPNDE